MSSPSIAEVSIVQPEVRLADPHASSDNRASLSILFSMYEALVRRDGTGGYLPALAETWSVSDDACSWTFKLRSPVAFHSGDLLSAADVVASLRRVCDPAMGGELGTQGVYRSYLEGADVVSVDAHTVRVDTAQPFADLLDLLVKFPIAPREALPALPARPVGSGPYRFVDAEKGLVVMERFADHWRGTPSVGRIVWRAETDSAMRVDDLLAGKADLVADISPRDAQRVESSDETSVVSAPSSVCTVFMCNLQSGVCLDRRVRQALNYALDVPGLIRDVMEGTARPISGPLTPAHFGHDPNTPPFPYDPHRARALLSEAGFPDGMRLVLDVPTRLPNEAPRLARRMAGMYAEVGVMTEVREFPDRPGYADMVRAKQIDDACCFDSSPLSTYRTLREKLHSGVRGPWWQGYDRPEVNELIERAQATVDKQGRATLYRHAHRMIREDAPWIFLYNPFNTWAVGPQLRGWSPDAAGLILFA